MFIASAVVGFKYELGGQSVPGGEYYYYRTHDSFGIGDKP